MKRTIMPVEGAYPDAIATADWHLQLGQPECRTDDFQSAMWRKVEFISTYAARRGAEILHAGDLLDYWDVSPELITLCIQNVPPCYCVAGQHELPRHRMDDLDKSALFTLVNGREDIHLLSGPKMIGFKPGLFAVYGCCWDDVPKEKDIDRFLKETKNEPFKILLWHRMTWALNPPFKGASLDAGARRLMDAYPDFDIIITGDNHQPFDVWSKDERHVVINPGSMMRLKADQAHHMPSVVEIWMRKDRVKIRRIPLPYENDVVSREHIERSQERVARMDALLGKVNSSNDTTLDFVDNLNAHLERHRVRKEVRQEIWNALETKP